MAPMANHGPSMSLIDLTIGNAMFVRVEVWKSGRPTTAMWSWLPAYFASSIHPSTPMRAPDVQAIVTQMRPSSSLHNTLRIVVREHLFGEQHLLPSQVMQNPTSSNPLSAPETTPTDALCKHPPLRILTLCSQYSPIRTSDLYLTR